MSSIPTIDSTFAVDPPTCSVPAAGGSSTHQIVNASSNRIAYKVKTSNNALIRTKPVFGFLAPSSSTTLEITRLKGDPKQDKAVIQFIDAPEDVKDAAAAFKTGTVAGEYVLVITAT